LEKSKRGFFLPDFVILSNALVIDRKRTAPPSKNFSGAQVSLNFS
jgi:hypothetical protein